MALLVKFQDWSFKIPPQEKLKTKIFPNSDLYLEYSGLTAGI